MNRLLPLVLATVLAGCASFPPASVSAGFMGADVTVATPGWSAPVKVAPSTVIQSPALLVPLGSKIADNDSATVTDGKITATVPISEAPVASPVLVVPSKGAQ